MVPMEKLRTWLAIIWFVGAGLVFVLMIAMSIGGQFGTYTDIVWEWLTPNIVPTIGTIVSAVSATALQQHLPNRDVRRGFAIAVGLLSSFYLLHLLVLIAGKQSLAIDTDHWVRVLHLSNLWLGPLQGVMAPMLGVVFLTKKR